MIFIVNAFSILLYGLIVKRKLTEDKYKKRYLVLCFFQMLLIQGLRSTEVGTDTIMYTEVYNNYLHSEYYAFCFTHFESGFQLLYNFLHRVSADEQGLLITISAITMVGFGYFIYKNSKDVLMSTFLFACMFYPNSFNVSRQYLALSLSINSYELIREKKYIKAALLVAVAFSIHQTSILMLVPFFIRWLKNWKAVRNILLILSAIVFIFGGKIVAMILPLVGKSYYISGVGVNYSVNRLFRMTTALTVVIAVVVLYLTKRVAQEDKEQMNTLTGVTFVNVIFGVLYLKFEFFSRLIESINLYILVSLPMGIRNARTRYRPLIELGVYCIAFLLMLNAVFNSNSGVESYKMFFM